MKQSIHADVTFEGAQGSMKAVIVPCLIDTGAQVSMLPRNIAVAVGAWTTAYATQVTGVFGPARQLPMVALDARFPALNGAGGRVFMVMDDQAKRPIIGLDILKALGITIDTTTHVLSQRNELWEAFKTFSGYGVAFYAGIQLLGSLSNDEAPAGPKRRRPAPRRPR